MICQDCEKQETDLDENGFLVCSRCKKPVYDRVRNMFM